MTQIDELERRIAAAMDRIGAGAAALGQGAQGGSETGSEPQADTEEVTQLRRMLEDERLANAQLEERVRGIRESEEDRFSTLEVQVEKARVTMQNLDGELQRLRKATKMLRDSNAALREAHAAGVSEPHLINKAMLAELESLRASRAADVAESRAILDTLEPLLAEAMGDSDGLGVMDAADPRETEETA